MNEIRMPDRRTHPKLRKIWPYLPFLVVLGFLADIAIYFYLRNLTAASNCWANLFSHGVNHTWNHARLVVEAKACAKL